MGAFGLLDTLLRQAKCPDCDGNGKITDPEYIKKFGDKCHWCDSVDGMVERKKKVI